jgi:hypothetical protein
VNDPSDRGTCWRRRETGFQTRPPACCRAAWRLPAADVQRQRPARNTGNTMRYELHGAPRGPVHTYRLPGQERSSRKPQRSPSPDWTDPAMGRSLTLSAWLAAATDRRSRSAPRNRCTRRAARPSRRAAASRRSRRRSGRIRRARAHRPREAVRGARISGAPARPGEQEGFSRAGRPDATRARLATYRPHAASS